MVDEDVLLPVEDALELVALDVMLDAVFDEDGVELDKEAVLERLVGPTELEAPEVEMEVELDALVVDVAKVDV